MLHLRRVRVQPGRARLRRVMETEAHGRTVQARA
jgi:hypothetical protein